MIIRGPLLILLEVIFHLSTTHDGQSVSIPLLYTYYAEFSFFPEIFTDLSVIRSKLHGVIKDVGD